MKSKNKKISPLEKLFIRINYGNINFTLEQEERIVRIRRKEIGKFKNDILLNRYRIDNKWFLNLSMVERKKLTEIIKKEGKWEK